MAIVSIRSDFNFIFSRFLGGKAGFENAPAACNLREIKPFYLPASPARVDFSGRPHLCRWGIQ